MRKILILLLSITIFLIISILITQKYITTNSDPLKEINCTDCKVEIPTKGNNSNLSKFGKATKITIAPIIIAPITMEEIKTTTNEPKKEIEKEIEKDKEIKIDKKVKKEIAIGKEEQTNEIKKITKEFNLYKKQKAKEIKKLKAELKNIKRRLLKSKKEIKRLKKRVEPKEYISDIVVHNRKDEVFNEVMLDSWREVVIDNEISIFDLAIRYYGNKNEYKKIYHANRNIIGSDLRITAGMLLKIPIEENYDEQPIILNID